MNRRHLLTLAPCATAGLLVPARAEPIAAEALTAAGFAISVQCWSFRMFTLFEAVEKSAAAGASVIEIFPGQTIGGPFGEEKVDPAMADDRIAAILKHCSQHGVAPANFGVTNVSEKEDEARVLFGFAKKLGLYGITTESLEALDTLEKLAKEYDIRVCFHNHPKPTKLWNPDKIWKAIEGRDERIGFCADIGHWATSGLDPLEVVRKVATRIHAFHMKDRAEIGTWTHDRPFGTGIIDNIAILREVRKHGFAGNVSIEYEHNWESSQSEIAQCAGYLRACGKL